MTQDNPHESSQAHAQNYPQDHPQYSKTHYLSDKNTATNYSSSQYPKPPHSHNYYRDYDNHYGKKPRGYYQHFSENISQSLENNQQRYNFYQSYQDHVEQHQRNERLHLLNCIDYFLDNIVRSVLECSQSSLYHYGYNTGIYEERSTAANVIDANENFVDTISLHLNDVPVSSDTPPSKNSKANNQIRFTKMDNGREIECQFTSSKTRSKLFYLTLDERDENYTIANTEALVFDFINIVLMNRRLGVVNVD